MQLAGIRKPKPKPIGKKTLIRIEFIVWQAFNVKNNEVDFETFTTGVYPTLEEAKEAVKHLDKCLIHEYRVYDKGKSVRGKLVYKR
jgi:hypothetical protein